MIECGFESLSIMACPSSLEIMSSFSSEEGHSTTSLDRSDDEVSPLQSCCFCHIERAGWALPTNQNYTEPAFDRSINSQTNLTRSHLNTPILNLQTWDFTEVAIIASDQDRLSR
jgi:hypothetical protein